MSQPLKQLGSEPHALLRVALPALPHAFALWQESLAEYVILWDDDIKPSPGCLAAYVQAFREHPEVNVQLLAVSNYWVVQ